MTIERNQRPLLFSDIAEQQYAARAIGRQARSLGQFFTPYPVARFMARWVAGAAPTRILDPAVGLGIFFRALAECDGHAMRELTGYDVDPGALAEAAVLLRNLPGCCELIDLDYLASDWECQYNGVVCNPPYHRFQDYDRAGILAEFQRRLGVTLSGFTNLYTLFLLKSLYQLAPGGRAAFIVPSEFLNADYGTPVKDYILRHGSLRYVIVFDFQGRVFDGALTTSCILLFARDGLSLPVEFVVEKSTVGIAHLARLETQLARYPAADAVGRRVASPDSTIKWRAYYQVRHTERYKRLVPLAEYGQVVRGIATGNNSYFTFSREKQREHEIDDRCLLPCLAKSSQATGPVLTPGDFERLAAANKNVFLLDAEGAESDAAMARYLRLGEATGAHQGFLTSHRHPWYAIEYRSPAPILVTVFSRRGLRFVRNEAGVRNLTCFHCLYLTPDAMDHIDALMAFLHTDLARQVFNDNRREYGRGLEKFEPNDLNRSSVIDLGAIPAETERQIVEVYRAFRQNAAHGQPVSKILADLDQLWRDLASQ